MTNAPDISEPSGEAEPTGRVLYTPVEAARALGIGRSTLYELLAHGELPSVRIGSCRRVPVAAVAAYVQRLIDQTPSHPDGTMVMYRSSGSARDAAVDGLDDGRPAMTRRHRTGRVST